MTTQLQGLTEEQRLEARERARNLVKQRAGKEPRRSDFQQHTIGQYTPAVTYLITAIMLVLLIGAFAVSAMRLFHIGSNTFYATIQHERSAAIAGAAIVLLSEAGAVGFTLFAGLLGHEKRREKAILYGAAAASVLLALVGNIQLALGAEWRGAITGDTFAFLEAVFPSVAVLVAAYVLKHFLLDGMKRRQDNEAAYHEALREWQARTADPEADPAWRSVYATALREKIMQVNASGRGRQDRIDEMATLTPDEWRALVWQELNADQWWREPAQGQASTGVVINPLAPTPAGVITAPQNGNGNGHHSSGGRV